jgi:N-acetyl sugar amidotransferase
MDTTDPLIEFDAAGVCSHCRAYDDMVAAIGGPDERSARLDALVKHLRRAGQGKDYDCIMGLSGGVDSSYLAWYVVTQLGLRPLVVHVDTGWNSELAVNNIQNIVQRLNLDMHTLVIDWDEMRDLQQAYFRSGVANLDVPQDHAFIASLYQEAKKYGIRDILNGGNIQTESILPNSWGYDASDARSLLAIHKEFGEHPLRTFPIYSNFKRFVQYPYIAKLKSHRPLEYIDYNKEKAKELLKSELGWRDYGGKHYESVFTKFFQSYYLPVKFGYDKRRAHLASLVVSGQISREQALEELTLPSFNPDEISQDKEYFAKKIGLSMNEFEYIMGEPPKSHADYDNSEALYTRLRTLKRRLRG